ncbi:hypothetical protein DCCM_2908 [Desulfocucumis palustris]|uniref:Uncharacterized protein n=1 Tax=Desulfocucumis palustris TaxID=1898651 RepID=A0A2L2XBV1_9FIRM|nr:hypothetical protein [Desulfocucumis palustris]GBF33797.1 hypothetical protein DCCM_2908 [Desulfocucumis palustris]
MRKLSKVNEIRYIKKPGIFIEELKKSLNNNGLHFSFAAIGESNINTSILKVKQFIVRQMNE